MGLITKYASFIKKHTPSLIYKIGAQAYIDKQFPRHLFVETCAQCNLACPYCPREKNSGNMPWEMFTGIIDEAKKYGARSFSLHLFNEPLLYPRIFEAIDYIYRANKRNTILLTTNGTLLERNGNLDKLIASKVSQVLWSWRPEVSFKEETKERLRRWGKFRVRFINELVPDEEREAWRDWPNQEERPLHDYGGNIDPAQWGGKSLSKSEKRWPCGHLWLSPAVAFDGSFLLCCVDPHRKEVLGNVTETPIGTLWQSARLQEVRDGHMRREFKGICANCDVWKEYPDMWFSWQKKNQ